MLAGRSHWERERSTRRGAPAPISEGNQVDQKTVITLEAEDLQELERILMDRDEKDALQYLRERIEKKVREAHKVECRPAFD